MFSCELLELGKSFKFHPQSAVHRFVELER